jgi:hypothetical protein
VLILNLQKGNVYGKRIYLKKKKIKCKREKIKELKEF